MELQPNPLNRRSVVTSIRCTWYASSHRNQGVEVRKLTFCLPQMSRHAERYPTVPAGTGEWFWNLPPRQTESLLLYLAMLDIFHRIQQSNVKLKGKLAFANEWKFFTQDPAQHFESLVSTGPHAGTLEAFETGVKLRTRYEDLLDEASSQRLTSFWASDSKRVIDTARYFAAGFFGIDWNNKAALQVIPESPDREADTLTPGRTCLKYRNNSVAYGHDYGNEMMNLFRSTYEPAIAARLAQENSGFRFTPADVFTMQLICGFETIAKGNSSWCDVFDAKEWQSFEYARDVIHFFRSGPGNQYSASMGWLWLNAPANLLRDGPSVGRLFFSLYVCDYRPALYLANAPASVHDGDMIPLLTALDLFPQTHALPVSHISQNRTWHTSDVVPMGGRIIFERLACPKPRECWSNALYPNHVYCEPTEHESFVRVNLNDGIVAIPWCDHGPGSSCPLDAFLEGVRTRGKDVDDFRDICGLKEGAADRITFLHQ